MTRTSHTVGSYKANLNNPGTSDESKEDSQQIVDEQPQRGDAYACRAVLLETQSLV